MFEQSRRYFKTKYEGIEFDFDGVDVKEGMIRFARPNQGMYKELLFLDTRSCLIWWKNLEDNIMKHEANKIIKMSYPVYKNESAITAVEKDWELIKSQMPRSDLIMSEDIVVFNMWLANNVIARNKMRISLEVLNDLAKTIIGKMRLKDHDDRLRIGKFYKADLKKTELNEAIEILKDYPHKGLRQHLEKVIEMEKGIYWLITSYYMLNKTEEQKAQVLSIAAGIEAYYTSISFFAPIIVPIYESEGKKKLLWWEWRNDGDEHAEAVEGSGVYLGNLYETVTKNRINEKDVLENLPETYIKSWVNLDDIEDENISSYCQTLDEMIARGFIYAKENENEVAFYRHNDKRKDINNKSLIIEDYINIVYLRERLANSKNEEDINDLIPYLNLLEINAEWTTAYINSLADNCFAVVEPTGDKDDQGRTLPKNARHLPHHAKGNGATGIGGTVDKPHLKNALARMNQIKPATDSISESELKSKAKNHLVAHAKKLKISDWGNSNLISEVKIMDLKLKSVDVDLTIDLENDNWVGKLDQSIEKAVTEKMSEGNAALDKIKKIEEVFGEEFTVEQMKVAKETSENYLKSKVDEVMKWGKVSGAIKDNEVEEKEKAFGKFKIDELDARAKDYMELAGVRNPQYKAMIELHMKGILPDNLEGIENVYDEKKSTVGASDKSYMVG